MFIIFLMVLFYKNINKQLKNNVTFKCTRENTISHSHISLNILQVVTFITMKFTEFYICICFS